MDAQSEMQRDLTVIIVTYNSAEQIDACLAALTRPTSARLRDVIVVDNASRDGTPALIRARYPTVRLREEAENWGFAGAVNRGVELAHGTSVALLNPDAIPGAGWVDQLATALDDARVGVAGGKVLSIDGRIQSVGAVYDSALMLPAYRGEGEPDVGQYGTPVDVWSAHGAAMAFPRHVWEELGGFDEGYFPAYLEESDFCERARRAGYRVITAPGAVVQHAESVSTGKGSAQFYYYFLRNRLRYAVKWLGWPAVWGEFRPAEHRRLEIAPGIDRRVARLVYRAGVPPLGPLDSAARAAVLAEGEALRRHGSVQDGIDLPLRLLGEARANSVHSEVQFQSRVPLVGTLRTLWNGVATRWYVRPSLDQQTRYNLALERALGELILQASSRAAADALDTALLAYRLGQITGADREPTTRP